MKKDAMEASFAEVIDLFPVLKERVDRAAGALSGGQQQMLAIARALMSRPRLVLLDEPLTGLAPVIQESVMEVLSGLRSQERSILLVEQNAQRSLAIADRGFILSEGRVTLEDTAESLSKDPRVKEGYLGTRDAGTSAPTHDRSRSSSNV
jgi:branched-chain amino acid transport system ATP-binding protein